ncbi:hypothetical protein FA15DRAFT_724459 [Coprinopsis marcescibilis]|uniref:TEA domain-containing protein n=1 Tax=Coprinopsis marcescibilis TaxID=230819 RepID=A0A5C3KGV3_COPMA|nr:hypothetical protein FA15DRAFT_724459 [Coprinopsis marcescibilis]
MIQQTNADLRRKTGKNRQVGDIMKFLSPEPLRRLPNSNNEDVAIPQLDNPRTQDVVHSIVKGRKSWKTLRGGEVVWPPELEAALIEGLENYKPDDSRETRLLGRFPLRNRFISDWIYEKTGKRRTAKQVGSRLQQLRDTCGGKRLVNLISPRRPIPVRSASTLPSSLLHRTNVPRRPPSLDQESESCSDASSASSSPTTPTEVHATLENLLYRGVAGSSSEQPVGTVVFIDLLPNQSLGEFTDGHIDSSLGEEELLWSERGLDVVRISSQPRYISDIDPTITFTSRTPTTGVSTFSLYFDEELIHSETAALKSLGPLSGSSCYLYSTPFLPGYWPRLLQTPDLSHCSIVHRVIDESQSSSRSVLSSTMYKFKYHSSVLAFNTATFSGSTSIQVPPTKGSNVDFNASFDTLLTMADDYVSDSPTYDRHNGFYDVGAYGKPEWQSCNNISPYHSPH